MIISVASGKGGTGKTTVAVNLALSLENVQLLDCDVEEPNAHLFIKPEIKEKISAFTTIPQVDETICTYCGKCQKVCAYNALAVIPSSKKKGTVLIFPHLCHGCGACYLLCPQKAIKEIKREIGIIESGTVANLQFVHGILNVGEVMSPPLIRQVKKHINNTKTVIIDAPPGTSCPMIAAIKNTDFCILVTEPTPFGLNDLILTVEVVRKLKIPFGIIINRSDIGDNKTEVYCRENNIPILMRIPFSEDIARLYSQGIPVVNENEEYKKEFIQMFESIRHPIKRRMSDIMNII